MRFLNVNQIKFHLILILLIEPVESGNLPPKRRSGVTAKNQHDRLFTSEGGKLYSRFPAECFQREIRRLIAGVQIAFPGRQPHSPERENRENEAGSFRHNPAKNFRSLEHGYVESGE
jgi:hypothetical protein